MSLFAGFGALPVFGLSLNPCLCNIASGTTIGVDHILNEALENLGTEYRKLSDEIHVEPMLGPGSGSILQDWNPRGRRVAGLLVDLRKLRFYTIDDCPDGYSFSDGV